MTPPLLIRNARVLTLAGPAGPRRGAAMADLSPLDRADVLIRDRRIAAIGTLLAREPAAQEIDAAGRVLMPAFVDAHTHACWAGDRLDEWDQKRRGTPYLEILKAGGGIMSTVRAVRAATEAQLAEGLSGRLDAMLCHGTLAVEVKSGYGLTTTDELKMLRAIAEAASRWPGVVVPTACIGHALDPAEDAGAFVDRTIGDTLPAVHDEFPNAAIDAYCEQGAWSLRDTLRLIDAALDLGHPVRVHADQFNDLGLIPEAVRRHIRSVDHLEASSPEHLRLLAESDTFGVMLPCTGYHTDGRYANARAFVDAGGALAIATNYNPGSAPCGSIPMAIALAVRHLGLSPAEAITACTVNAAALLGLADRGRIEVGLPANLILLRHTDERQLAYEFGMNPVEWVIAGGVVV